MNETSKDTAKEAVKFAGKAALATGKFAGKTTQLIIVWLLALFTIGYLLPGAIATTRGCYHSMSIWLINIFLGWSIIGWFWALIWSFTCDKEPLAEQIAKATAKQ